MLMDGRERFDENDISVYQSGILQSKFEARLPELYFKFRAFLACLDDTKNNLVPVEIDYIREKLSSLLQSGSVLGLMQSGKNMAEDCFHYWKGHERRVGHLSSRINEICSVLRDTLGLPRRRILNIPPDFFNDIAAEIRLFLDTFDSSKEDLHILSGVNVVKNPFSLSTIQKRVNTISTSRMKSRNGKMSTDMRMNPELHDPDILESYGKIGLRKNRLSAYKRMRAGARRSYYN